MRWWVGLGTYGLAGGLENGLAGGLLGFFCFLMIYRGGRPNVPAAVNRLTAAGKAARRRKATIYRDLYAVADAFARCGKANSSATKNVSGSSDHDTKGGGGLCFFSHFCLCLPTTTDPPLPTKHQTWRRRHPTLG